MGYDEDVTRRHQSYKETTQPVQVVCT